MLLDTLHRPMRDLRLSIVDACNFRCRYCMPLEKFSDLHPFLTRHERLTRHELVRLARLAIDLGVRKIRVTGGEPLLRHDVVDIVRDLARLNGLDDLALITNGFHLARDAAALRDAGLHRLTVSLDALDDATLSRLNGRQAEVAPILAGIAAAERAGFAPLKLNAVVLRGINDHVVVDLARFARERGHVMRFIEYMDVGTLNDWGPEQVVPAADIIARIAAELPLNPLPANYAGEVATRWAFADGGGEVGVIASVSQPFCGACTRARIAADGRLYTCLFARDGLDLRTPLRAGASDDELRARLAAAWRVRDDRYSELRHAARAANAEAAKVEMYQVGG